MEIMTPTSVRKAIKSVDKALDNYSKSSSVMVIVRNGSKRIMIALKRGEGHIYACKTIMY